MSDDLKLLLVLGVGGAAIYFFLKSQPASGPAGGGTQPPPGFPKAPGGTFYTEGGLRVSSAKRGIDVIIPWAQITSWISALFGGNKRKAEAIESTAPPAVDPGVA